MSLQSISSGVSEKKAKNDINVEVAEVQIDDDNLSFIEGDPSYMTNSPYPEVRASVTTEFDEHTHLNHWRTWTLTTIFVVVFAGVNQFFSLRYPSLTIGYTVAQIVAFPIGKALATLPNYKPKFLPRWFELNPGPYTKQEHAVLTIVVALTSSTAYAMGILLAQSEFYHQKLNVGYQLLLALSTQLLGYGASGLTRRWIVYPAAMVWPQNLITTTVFSTLAKDRLSDAVHVSGFNWSRYKMFVTVASGSFVWYWFPGFIFKALSYFSWVCWIAPNNIVVNQIFGVSSGLGIIPITFDWTQITQALSVSPLATPYWVSANTYGSVFIFFVLILPCLYYTNTWYAKYMPMISSTTFDNKQKSYNVSKILTPDFRLNREAYKAYSPLFVPYSYLLSYALNFAAISAIFVHSALYNGKDIMQKFRNSKHGGEDIHKRLMNRFNEVPDWWYGVLLVISIGLAFATICGYPHNTQLPAWGLVVALLITFVGFIPQGMLEGLTNQHVGLNIITELIAGYMFPGNPIANMMIKVYGFIPMRQGLDFSRDLKLAQYMKVPPRFLFVIQIYGTIWACLVNVGVQIWMTHNIKDICTPAQSNGFTCPGGRTFFNASIIWMIPQELFSIGKIYNPLLYFFLIGAIFPVITYALYKRWPTRWYGRIHGPIFFTGSGNIPPSTLYNYSLYFATCFVFNYYIKHYYTTFHTKYNNVISAGFDAGVAISAVIIFLCVTYPGGSLTWWGNTVYKNTADFKGTPFYKLEKGETFGPKTW